MRGQDEGYHNYESYLMIHHGRLHCFVKPMFGSEQVPEQSQGHLWNAGSAGGAMSDADDGEGNL